MTASERAKQQQQQQQLCDSSGYRKSDSAAAHCGACAENGGRDSGKDSPIYHELDPVVVSGEWSSPSPPPSASFHAYQSIVDVHTELVQLRGSFDPAAAVRVVAPSPPACGDVTGHVTTSRHVTTSPTAGSKWTLFSRLRLPRRPSTTTTAARQQHPGQDVVVSASGRDVVTSPPPPAHWVPSVSGSCSITPPSACCRPASCQRADHVAAAAAVPTSSIHFRQPAADVRRRLAPSAAAGTRPRDAAYRDSAEQCDSEVRRRGRRRLVNSSPFSSPCCGVRMAEMRAAWRIQSCGPRIVPDLVPTYVTTVHNYTGTQGLTIPFNSFNPYPISIAHSRVIIIPQNVTITRV